MEFFGFPQSPGKWRDSALNCAATASFHILYISSFTYPFIRCHIVWVTEKASLNKLQIIIIDGHVFASAVLTAVYCWAVCLVSSWGGGGEAGMSCVPGHTGLPDYDIADVAWKPACLYGPMVSDQALGIAVRTFFHQAGLSSLQDEWTSSCYSKQQLVHGEAMHAGVAFLFQIR
jgi:hypothetical protein